MRFSKKKYPLLDGFNFDFNLRGDLDLGGNNEEKTINGVRNIISSVIVPAIDNVSYVSKRFLSDCVDNEKRLIPTYNDWLNPPEAGQSFLYILGDGTIYLGIIGVYYIVFFNHTLQGFVFVSKEREVFYAGPRGYSSGVILAEYATIPIVVNRFKNIAEIKTKHLPPKKKVVEFHCRYKSDFNFPIELLTENWYTKSVQGSPFVVRSHWRMQAHGKGYKERKLILISEVVKKGYTKGAYKMNRGTLYN